MNIETLVTDPAARKRMNARLTKIGDQSRQIADNGRSTAGEAAKLFRDLFREQPLLVIGVIAVAAYGIARFGSVRALGTAARIGAVAAELAGEAGRV